MIDYRPPNCRECGTTLSRIKSKSGLMLLYVLACYFAIFVTCMMSVVFLPGAFVLFAIIFALPGFVLVTCGGLYASARYQTDYPTCPSCRYDLRGSTSGHCPECGNQSYRS